jgi:hypothetical protein
MGHTYNSTTYILIALEPGLKPRPDQRYCIIYNNICHMLLLKYIITHIEIYTTPRKIFGVIMLRILNGISPDFCAYACSLKLVRYTLIKILKNFASCDAYLSYCIYRTFKRKRLPPAPEAPAPSASGACPLRVFPRRGNKGIMPPMG